jgi:hypothetical protein
LQLTGATHNFAVGEKITVTGVSARYNGTFYITAVTTNTVTYASSGVAESTVSSAGVVVNNTLASGYNGDKVVEFVPTATTIQYFAYEQQVDTSSTVFSSPTVTNVTNTGLNGTFPIVSVPSATQFTYTR